MRWTEEQYAEYVGRKTLQDAPGFTLRPRDDIRAVLASRISLNDSRLRELIYPGMTEQDEWMPLVCLYARQHDWHIYHTRDSRGSNKGFPDLVLARPPILEAMRARPGKMLFIELKDNRRSLTPEQRHWIALLKACRQDARVWRPKDIVEVIATLK